jgi:diamine N-acetyltransferase
MTIRPATISDIPVLRNLADKIWRSHYPGIITVEQIDFMLGWMYSEAEIARQLEAGPRWEIAEIAGEPIGFTSFGMESDGRVKLHKLYIATEHQGQGWGSKLLSHVVKEAQKCAASEVWLQVNKLNVSAIAAYKKAGFHVASEATFKIGNGFVMDDFLMAKSVPSA